MLETGQLFTGFVIANRENCCFEARIAGQTGLELWDLWAENPVLRQVCTGCPQAVDGFSTGSCESIDQLLKLNLRFTDQSQVHSKSNLKPRECPENTLKSHRLLVDNPGDKLWISCA
jgi:hypothetical protein